MSDDLTLSTKECAFLLGIERHRWGKWAAKGLTPPPLNPGERKRLWSKATILAWVNSGGLTKAMETRQSP
jgi:predicted DNA-binding transcriptional regulator AlpA